MQEPLRVYRASKRVQRTKLVVVSFTALPFLFIGILLLLYSSRNIFEMCFALTFISPSLLVLGQIRIVCLGLPTELRVYADRLVDINPWVMIRAANTYDFIDITIVFYDRDGDVKLKLFSSFWIRGLNSEVFRDAAEAQEFCQYLTELLVTPSSTINKSVA